MSSSVLSNHLTNRANLQLPDSLIHPSIHPITQHHPRAQRFLLTIIHPSATKRVISHSYSHPTTQDHLGGLRFQLTTLHHSATMRVNSQAQLNQPVPLPIPALPLSKSSELHRSDAAATTQAHRPKNRQGTRRKL